MSRVSAMTGIGRKEVRRLQRSSGEYLDDPRVELSPLSDVLHRWFTEPRYLDKKGQPKSLPFRGGRASFSSLVKKCAGDLPVGAVRVELLRCGAVVEDPGGHLLAIRRHVVPNGLEEKAITGLVFNLRSLTSTVAFNLDLAPSTFGRIERFAQSDPLTENSIASLREPLRERISTFSIEIDNFFAHAKKSPHGEGRRVGVGVYYYEDEDK